MLHLDRPLVVFDLEATDVDPSAARIIQVALVRLEPTADGPRPAGRFVSLVNPGVPIPADVAELTGIASSDVQDAPAFRALISRLDALMHDADLAGFNVLTYDVPLLKAEYERANAPLPAPPNRKVLDVYKLEQALVPRTLSALYEAYTGASLDDAHDAAVDVQATLDVLDGQLQAHQPDARTPAALVDLIRGDYLDDHRKLKRVETSSGKTGVEVCFGKHAGKTITQIQDEDPGYLAWMRDTITDLRPHIDAALRSAEPDAEPEPDGRRGAPAEDTDPESSTAEASPAEASPAEASPAEASPAEASPAEASAPEASTAEDPDEPSSPDPGALGRQGVFEF